MGDANRSIDEEAKHGTKSMIPLSILERRSKTKTADEYFAPFTFGHNGFGIDLNGLFLKRPGSNQRWHPETAHRFVL